MTAQYRGKVVHWNQAKGFGFVKPEEGGPDVFLHITDLPDDVDRDVPIGTEIEFEVGPCRQGMKAVAVRLISPYRAA
jgi:CspA family cold shock protein